MSKDKAGEGTGTLDLVGVFQEERTVYPKGTHEA